MKLQRGQKVRFLRDTDTAFVDPRFEYPGIDYEEWDRIHEPHRVLAGSIARFASFLAHIEGLSIVTDTTAETPLCEVVLGRTRFWEARVPADAIEACDPALEVTPLCGCVDRTLLPPTHCFWEDPVDGASE
ncbi:MAG TPA: hypothetical protein VIF57_19955 [Polyangia bacterium]|jgi:hypothetical protein